ncbi:MAG: DNA cytosine methyltransferase [Oscillospiraceae bacterium]|nr:DNA cytosine methyltransferase [Oscillospiraceae bacterium]
MAEEPLSPAQAALHEPDASKDQYYIVTKQLTLGSLFDGIGGFPRAGSFFGIKPLWASEIMPRAVSVTMRHFPDMEHFGDITALDGAKLPPVDIITFGSPCQDLSTAGKRAGIDGKRSNLFFEAIRIIDEMREATHGKYPKYAVWENVPGALSSGNPRGSDFQTVLEAFTKTDIPVPDSGRWANAGMVRVGGVNLAWRILDASGHGVPQRRRRIFLVANFGAGCAGEVLFIEKSLRGYFKTCGEARERTSADAQGGPGGSVPECNVTLAFAANQRDEVRDLGAASGALQAQPGMKQQTFIAQCLTPWDIRQSRIFIGDGVSPTLAGADGGGGRNPGGLVCAACVCEPKTARTLTARGDGSPNVDSGPNVVAVGVQQNHDGDVRTSGTAYTLATNSNASGRNAPLVAHPTICGTLVASGAGLSRPAGMASEPDLCVAYECPAYAESMEPVPINDRATRYQGGGPTRNGDGAGNGLGVGKPGDPAPTLSAGDKHLVATFFNQQRSDAFKEDTVAGTQTARQYKDSTDLVCQNVSAVDCRNHRERGDVSGTLQAKNAPGYSLNYQNPVRTGYIVRRLTPTECERLQGFPDGWTAFRHDGKVISDTRRYQMLGNSVAVPVVAFVLGNIVAQMVP